MKTVGELNGWRVKLFSLLLPVITVLIPISLGWGTWVTNRILVQEQMLSSIKAASGFDRFTASMYIEAQDELSDRNKNLNWLTSKDVHEIQINNPPYKH